MNIFGLLLLVGGVMGFYLDYRIVCFLFHLGHGISEALNTSAVVGTGIGLIATLLLFGVIAWIAILSGLGIIYGLSAMAD